MAFEINEGLASLLALLTLGAGCSLVFMAGLFVRVKMHAGHFDVNDKNIDRANESSATAIIIANKATADAAYAKGATDTLVTLLNKKKT